MKGIVLALLKRNGCVLAIYVVTMYVVIEASWRVPALGFASYWIALFLMVGVFWANSILFRCTSRMLATLLTLVIGSVAGCIALFATVWMVLDRTREFRAQAELGQPIVRAIEQYRRDVGQWPPSLTNLVPGRLPLVPDLSGSMATNYEGWTYVVATNGTGTTYRLSYYMGRGGVVYDPPNWYGIDEGHTKVVLSNR